jgi:hypothetical protein
VREDFGVCALHPEALAPLEDWMTRQRRIREARTDRLAALAKRL